MTSTRLSPEKYVEHLHADGERLIEVALDGVDRSVPGCPGWTVDDLVVHVGSVYAHKRAVLRLGRRPAEGEWEVPAPGTTPDEHLDWCHAQLHGLAHELAHRDPRDGAWTWHAADQSVGFWQRRMALETVVHRIDAEQADKAVTPVDADLARDGIGEVLQVLLAGVPAIGGPDAAGDRVAATIGGTRVSAPAPDLFLWLWGRLPDDVVTCDGPAAALAEVRRVLQEATT
jgi:uncharacterized protein (TIGR03083 family)